ncbi:Uncharacterised protein [Mycobacteroides abscessus subsp. abscessus]|nr:Uncharacterised protein [Mycobacteroides abscessus subsp. abscessus]
MHHPELLFEVVVGQDRQPGRSSQDVSPSARPYVRLGNPVYCHDERLRGIPRLRSHTEDHIGRRRLRKSRSKNGGQHLGQIRFSATLFDVVFHAAHHPV